MLLRRCESQFAEGGNHLEDLDIDGRITIEGILEKLGEKLWAAFTWL
jgi:hypothetical protein